MSFSSSTKGKDYFLCVSSLDAHSFHAHRSSEKKCLYKILGMIDSYEMFIAVTQSPQCWKCWMTTPALTEMYGEHFLLQWQWGSQGYSSIKNPSCSFGCRPSCDIVSPVLSLPNELNPIQITVTTRFIVIDQTKLYLKNCVCHYVFVIMYLTYMYVFVFIS